MALDVVVSNFSFQYWKNAPPALSDVNLTIRSGSVCAILGPTNAGKSTLLQGISGVLGSHNTQGNADGTFQIGGEFYSPLPRKVLFPTVGLTLQEPYYQVSGLRDTVFEEISLTLETLGIAGTEINSRTQDILDRFGLAHLAIRKPFTLSGGELQRVALATILVANPPVLLMDEPSNSLDGLAQQRLASIVCSMKGSATVLFADCQLDLAIKTADQFVVMNEGHVLFSGGRQMFIQKMAEFGNILPVTQWTQALESLQKLPTNRRISRVLGI